MKVSTRFWTFGTQKATTTSASWRVDTAHLGGPGPAVDQHHVGGQLVQQLPSQPLEEGFAMEVPVELGPVEALHGLDVVGEPLPAAPSGGEEPQAGLVPGPTDASGPWTG